MYTLKGRKIEALRPLSGLYIVATPIGNLGDMTVRALDTLAAADLIACEDTRVTGKLLAHYGITTRMLAYHDHNAHERRPELLQRLGEGAVVALVSDAGTPLVSDPGYKLVSEALDHGFPVIPIPGASSVMAALVAAGLPTDAFLFAGFLPARTVARRKRLAELAATPASLVIFESAPRLAASLADMAVVLGDRAAVVTRELTKRYEERRGGSLAELAAHYDRVGPPKGEIVVVIGPPQPAGTTPAQLDELLTALLESESVSRAAQAAAEQTGLPRRDLYRRALALAARSLDD
ncbi:MAG: 16S rRNA (cytidine(1402)-2'-O)-methyltransferase [Alphaproteobacteria bacterium]